MKTSISNLRLMIKKILLENTATHRTMAGRLVSNDSEECWGDICNRIDDAMYQRDNMTGGTATRAYYNGVLADLRKKKRRLSKSYGFSLEKQ